jgi:hypothetical protein
MKISDMTDIAFEREMQRILGDVLFWCIRLDEIGDYSLNPTPVTYIDGTGQQPFPLAMELKRIWNYARGEGTCPAEINDIIQSLCELLWCPVAASSYEIPSAWWKEPLGFMCNLAWARQALDLGENLTTEQLALLGEVSVSRIKQLCQSGEILAEKVPQARGKKMEWNISAEVALSWLKSRE